MERSPVWLTCGKKPFLSFCWRSVPWAALIRTIGLMLGALTVPGIMAATAWEGDMRRIIPLPMLAARGGAGGIITIITMTTKATFALLPRSGLCSPS